MVPPVVKERLIVSNAIDRIIRLKQRLIILKGDLANYLGYIMKLAKKINLLHKELSKLRANYRKIPPKRNCSGMTGYSAKLLGNGLIANVYNNSLFIGTPKLM